MKDVSFLVPCYNNAATVVKALQSIEKLEGNIDFEIVLVDDGSTDNSQEFVRRYLAQTSRKINLISKPNGGEASALNLGLTSCSGKFIAIVEADVELDSKWLEFVKEEFKDPQVMGVGGYIQTAKEDFWIARLAGYEVEYKFLSKEHFCKHISSANAIYRREAFDLVGNFNEKLMNASLDADFNGRIIEKNYKLAYCRLAIALHHFKETFWGYLKRQYAYARFRVHLGELDLYPQDRFLAFNVLMCSTLLLTPLIYIYNPIIAAYLILFVVLLQIFQTLKFFFFKRDPAWIFFPLILILRNVIAAVGYFIGFINKSIGRY